MFVSFHPNSRAFLPPACSIRQGSSKARLSPASGPASKGASGVSANAGPPSSGGSPHGQPRCHEPGRAVRRPGGNSVVVRVRPDSTPVVSGGPRPRPLREHARERSPETEVRPCAGGCTPCRPATSPASPSAGAGTVSKAGRSGAQPVTQQQDCFTNPGDRPRQLASVDTR